MPEADQATILTVWLPLTPATLENGCMTVVARSHRHGIDSPLRDAPRASAHTRPRAVTEGGTSSP